MSEPALQPVELRTHTGAVHSVRPLTPILLEVELAGLDGVVQVAPDTFAFVMVAVDGSAIDPAFAIEDYQVEGTNRAVRGAYYTLRRSDRATGRITLWVVLHDSPGGVASWMRTARSGDPVLVWGPRPGFMLRADSSSYLLVADETGFAAVAAIIDSLPDDVDVVARLELADASHAPEMPRHPRLDLQWVHRSGAPGTGDQLHDAVASLDLGDPARWAAFGGAESQQITRVRHLLRHERNLAADQVLMTGYWRLARN